MRRIADFFILASGVNTALLEQCPTERSKYAGIGAAVFFTGLFACLAAGYALFTVFDSWWIASSLGILWGFMIFNIDRYIVSSMRKETRRWREYTSALPRLLMAIGIALTISKPLELKIFEKEIEAELVVMHAETRTRQEEQIRARFTAISDQYRQDMQLLKEELTAKELQRNRLIQQAQQEADGTGGSMRRNAGPIYQIKKADADRANKEYERLLSVNQSRINLLEGQISEQDSLMQAALLQAEHTRMDGPAARLEALNRLAATSSAMAWANIFIVLLFIMVEITPIVVKLLSKPGPYDYLLRKVEHGFATREASEMASASSALRTQSKELNTAEQEFLIRKLNSELS